MKTTSTQLKQSGGVSIFIVLFTALILTIITVSFITIMTRNQEQTTTNDLSQRAYNSALAGVEDGKRVLIAAKRECDANPTSAQCANLKAAVVSGACDTPARAGITQTTGSDGNVETQVGPLPGDNQAYTCVKIRPDTTDYQGLVSNDGDSTLVPLRGLGQFDKVRVTWFTKDDATKAGQSPIDSSIHQVNVSVRTVPNGLPQQSSTTWGSGSGSSWGPAPPVLRTQYIPADADVNTLDTSAHTLLLYPNNSTGSNSTAFTNDDRSTANPGNISPTKCQSFTTKGACMSEITVPNAVPAGRTAYLQVSSYYHGTSFVVELLDNAGATVPFDAVQPEIDSTGRAGDLFRRVLVRVRLGGAPIPHPDAAVNVRSSLCKGFAITGSLADYNGDSSGTCDP